mgnify:CR=1 FL=1|tara:strand:- start:293862 stop:296426 length:2565 start_codon:yes stop_codon:yes gene_type:complete
MFLKRIYQRITVARPTADRCGLGRARRPSHSPAAKRLCRIENLETRRLLVAEGAAFDISQAFDTTGLVGSFTSTIDWGDGTTSQGSVTGHQATGPLTVRFVYANNDTFFSGANSGRRAILQAAADSIIERFTDDLAAIRPTGLLQWTATTIDPNTGQTQRTANLSVAANELVIYVGARNFSGNKIGEGAPGTYEFAAVNNLTQQQLDQIIAFRNTVITRGESGTTGNSPTDFATWGGTLAFDTDTNFYYGLDVDGLGENQVDFYSVAAHELLHVMGFGVRYTGATSSWEYLTRNGTYLGAKGNAAYPGGNIPLDPDVQHFSETALYQGQPLLTNPEISRGVRYQLTPVDLAVMDDLGWSANTATASVAASHVYADDGNYPVQIVLSGSRIGDVTRTQTANVTNVSPTLTAGSASAVFAGETLSITNIGNISDPGFRNTSSDPPTAETFSYTINWGDGTAPDRGTATIDRHGTSKPSVTTLASFDGSHVYESSGTYTVGLQVVDDDGGTRSTSFDVTVLQQPQLSLRLESETIRESDGAQATRLIVQRSGPALASDQNVILASSDTSEAIIPGSVVIRAGDTSASVFVDAVDDTLLDGLQQVAFAASGTALLPAQVTLNVADHETISASVSGNQIAENRPGSIQLTVRRSNTDLAAPLTIAIGGRQSEVDIDAEITIAAQMQELTIPISPIDDDEPEPTSHLTYTFTAAGYVSGEVEFSILDDEPPLFQNAANRYDIDGNGEVLVADALRAVNELSRRQGQSSFLDPQTQQPNGVFFDVNGDYQFTALDALIVINELSRQRSSLAETESTIESIAMSSSAALVNLSPDSDDERENSRVAFFAEHGSLIKGWHRKF